MTKKRIVGVIGLGHVGAHVAYALAVQGIADELILVDQKEQKLASEVQDLRDAAAYLPHRVTVRAGDFADLGECDVIVNSVGKIELLETHDRLTEMDFTIPAVRSYAHKIKESGFDGVLINITNPCDIVTRELALGVGLPRGRVFGTGTGLDTSPATCWVSTAASSSRPGPASASRACLWTSGPKPTSASASTAPPCRRSPSAAAG